MSLRRIPESTPDTPKMRRKMPVKKGDKVKLHFTGRLEEGGVIASTRDKDPVEVRAGAGQLLPGVDEALIGMQEGEEKELVLPPEKSFGRRREDLVITKKKRVLQRRNLKVGQRIFVRVREGKTLPAEVVRVKKGKVVLDLNHPLAGEKIVFRVKVVSIG